MTKAKANKMVLCEYFIEGHPGVYIRLCPRGEKPRSAYWYVYKMVDGSENEERRDIYWTESGWAWSTPKQFRSPKTALNYYCRHWLRFTVFKNLANYQRIRAGA